MDKCKQIFEVLDFTKKSTAQNRHKVTAEALNNKNGMLQIIIDADWLISYHHHQILPDFVKMLLKNVIQQGD